MEKERFIQTYAIIGDYQVACQSANIPFDTFIKWMDVRQVVKKTQSAKSFLFIDAVVNDVLATEKDKQIFEHYNTNKEFKKQADEFIEMVDMAMRQRTDEFLRKIDIISKAGLRNKDGKVPVSQTSLQANIYLVDKFYPDMIKENIDKKDELVINKIEPMRIEFINPEDDKERLLKMEDEVMSEVVVDNA